MTFIDLSKESIGYLENFDVENGEILSIMFFEKAHIEE